MPISILQKWLRFAGKTVLIGGIAVVPATAQLLVAGFIPPAHVPFGIEAEDVPTHHEPILWIDARPEDLFAIAHVPGALSLNLNNWDHGLSHLFETYQPGKTVIVYCSSGCSASEEIASKIRDLGIDPVLVLEGGFEAWQKTFSHS